MQSPLRLNRSLLYIPASKQSALQKAADLAVDIVAFDLEDAVAPEEKANAREALRVLRKNRWPQHSRTLVRINSLRSEWGTEDILCAIALQPDGIILPKVESAEDIQLALESLENCDTPSRLTLWFMVETPAAFLRLDSVLTSLNSHAERFAGLILGANDLAYETRVDLERYPEALEHWRAQLILLARTHGLTVIDCVHNNFKDMQGLEHSARKARAAGFDGKSIIHPAQIDIVNEAFSPSKEEIATAQSLISAFEKPENQGKGAISHNGKMAEAMHLRQAKSILEISELIARRSI